MSSIDATSHARSSLHPTAVKPRADDSPPEPFGQHGVRQYIVPALTLMSLILSCLSVAMWWRSYEAIDVLSREAGYSSYAVRSVIGRILVIRADWHPDSFRGYDHDDTGWRYSTEFMRDLPPDGWADTWKKRVGVEWGRQSLYTNPAIVGGFWLRVRWPTVAVIAAILPLARTTRHYLRRKPARIG